MKIYTLMRTKAVRKDPGKFEIAIIVEVKDIVQWMACQRYRMDVMEVKTEESRVTDVVDLDTKRETAGPGYPVSLPPRSGPSEAKPPVQVHRVGCAVQLPEVPPQEPTGDNQVLELKSGGQLK